MTIVSEGLRLLREGLARQRGLCFGLAWQAIALLGSAAGLLLDRRRILGLNPWVKPIKFELSILLFLLTMLLLLQVLIEAGRAPRAAQLLGWGFAACLGIEIVVICLQSLRGVPSHMNTGTRLDGSLFAVMGLFVVLNTILTLGVLWLWCLPGVPVAAALLWAVRLGLLFQLAAAVEGLRIVANGGHTVVRGVQANFAPLDVARDSGPGLPLLNWSTAHGDLRVAHFAALHALQLLPLAALLLMAGTPLGERGQVAAVFVVALVYAGGTWWLFAEALRGLPVVAVR